MLQIYRRKPMPKYDFHKVHFFNIFSADYFLNIDQALKILISSVNLQERRAAGRL